MSSGLKFNRGVKQLRLEKGDIADALDFPDDFEFKNDKERGRYFKNFVDDVTRFDEKVAAITKPIYDSATDEISTWILRKSKNGAQKTLSVFSPDDDVRRIRTALVQCNFTDISRLIADFRRKMLDFETEEREIRETIITENDAIHEIIGKVSEMFSQPTVNRILIIRQFESLRPHFLDSLINLLYSNEKCRAVMSRLRLVVCVSTSPAFFTQTCDMETTNLMELKQFKFTELNEVFVEIISTGIHAFFKPPRSAPRTIEEDDPKLLASTDCAPALFSGPFMKYLKNRFLACDYSVSALTRAIQFALLQKYIEDPLWRENSAVPPIHEMTVYDTVLATFLEEFGHGRGAKFEFAQIHMEIQWNPGFWAEIETQPIYRERRQFLTNSRQNLMALCARILERFEPFLEISKISNFAEKLRILMRNLDEAYEAESSGPLETSSTQKSSGAKMTLFDLQKARKEAIEAKQHSPIAAGKSAIFSHIFHLFSTVLRPYPDTWRCVIGKCVNGESVDAFDETEIERTLLARNQDEPLSVAWRALLCHRNFKMVPIGEWAETFLKNIKMPKSEAKGAFFAAAAQLEHIGLIRGAADKKSTNVHVLYHPISVVPSI